jgi:hypothetical protein
MVAPVAVRRASHANGQRTCAQVNVWRSWPPSIMLSVASGKPTITEEIEK